MSLNTQHKEAVNVALKNVAAAHKQKMPQSVRKAFAAWDAQDMFPFFHEIIAEYEVQKTLWHQSPIESGKADSPYPFDDDLPF